MSPIAEEDVIAPVEPYKGVESYRQEDSDIFFGRTAEGESIAAKILSSRFTVLHAQSGAGKTSLLNAKIIPNLQAAGNSPVTIRLQQDPVESVRTCVLLGLLPPPSVELATLERLLKLGDFADKGVTIGESLDFFDQLPVWDARRANIVEPIGCEIAIPGAATRATGKATSMFARLLRSTIELRQYSDHLEAIGLHSTGCVGKLRGIDVNTPLLWLIEILGSNDFSNAYEKVIGALYVPQPELIAFVGQLAAVYGAQISNFSVILIFDQFEELFTLFAPSLASHADSSEHNPTWKLRSEFLKQLRDLYRAATQVAGMDLMTSGLDVVPSRGGGALPLRIVLSMRDEYIAQLDPLKAFVPNLLECAYHLNLLNREQARDAITRPAGQFKFRYAEECLKEIIEALTRDDGLIEPAHLQLVCERLWQVQGKQLSREGLAAEPMTADEEVAALGESNVGDVTINTLDTLNGVSGILSTYLSGFLDRLPISHQQQMLEMLEPLVTTSRTRNIVEKDILTRVPYKSVEMREALFSKMVDAKIVRIERRLGGNFVEIVHEFLIDGILKEIRGRLLADAEHSRLRLALADLKATSSRRYRAILDDRTFKILHEHRGNIVWDQGSIEIMARTAIEEGKDRATCGLWLRQANDAVFGSIQQTLDGISLDSDPLTIRELTAALSLPEIPKLRPEVKLVVLRSLLRWCGDVQRTEIKMWIKEADLHG